jgi:hypothetical protein
MNLESREMRLQKFKQGEDLIINQVDNAIALFDQSHQLIVFNNKLTVIWGLPPAFLEKNLRMKLLLTLL